MRSRPALAGLVVVTNSILTPLERLPADHPMRRKLVVLSVAPMLAHHIAELSDLPPPDIDPMAPTYAMHGTSGARREMDVDELRRREEAEMDAMEAAKFGSRSPSRLRHVTQSPPPPSFETASTRVLKVDLS